MEKTSWFLPLFFFVHQKDIYCGGNRSVCRPPFFCLLTNKIQTQSSEVAWIVKNLLLNVATTARWRCKRKITSVAAACHWDCDGVKGSHRTNDWIIICQNLILNFKFQWVSEKETFIYQLGMRNWSVGMKLMFWCLATVARHIIVIMWKSWQVYSSSCE